jgi:hydrogenase small subunit
MIAQSLREEFERRGITRRDFLRFCASMAAILALPETSARAIAAAIEHEPKPVLVWLEFQDCAGNTESFLRAAHPTVADLILDSISLNYHETLMAAAGSQAESALQQTIRDNKGKYIALVEGSIPTGFDGAYCTIGGRTAIDIAREVCGNAAATVAVGTCAAYGGIPAAAPNPTGALSVADAVPGLKTLINMSACPANAENITALIVYYMTLKQWPPLDQFRRPLFAYGTTIHDNCERRAHFDNGNYVEQWGDEGHRLGYCLYKVGCKGPVTSQNCPVARWNDGTNWPVGCGHPCVGCAEPNFWDTMTPFYEHLPETRVFLERSMSVDQFGIALGSVVGAGFAAYGVAQVIRNKRSRPEQSDDKVATDSREDDK